VNSYGVLSYFNEKSEDTVFQFITIYGTTLTKKINAKKEPLKFKYACGSMSAHLFIIYFQFGSTLFFNFIFLSDIDQFFIFLADSHPQMTVSSGYFVSTNAGCENSVLMGGKIRMNVYARLHVVGGTSSLIKN
jgi:hypothetical protein